MPPTSRLLVLEELVPDEPPPGLPSAEGRFDGLVDLLMLVMMEGYDRTEVQYRALLDEAGFDVVTVRTPPTANGRAESAVEARPR